MFGEGLFKKKSSHDMTDAEFQAAQAKKAMIEKGTVPVPGRVMDTDGVIRNSNAPVEAQKQTVKDAHPMAENEEWREAA